MRTGEHIVVGGDTELARGSPSACPTCWPLEAEGALRPGHDDLRRVHALERPLHEGTTVVGRRERSVRKRAGRGCEGQLHRP